ncbi:hypothetical protein FIU97_19495 (plasmid) [Roseivivax sp. THAF40]|uniref:hypothetical protein n=1 Tax=unclassified Roseivivax TaxID=2639302 RepID=UPI001267E425|nr:MULTISPECIES: hypothetical protein [unclassified Roseivivax]QFS84879.1 hypothetical protein FIV09_18710 [Roseivivax sp. THAF197b]QFT48781.1 hypothetical protein FIU97_19495 [Roseivivax sp. THAF40]
MTAAARRVPVDSTPAPDDVFHERPLLEHLRDVARTNRCKGYIDLFGACAALSDNREVARYAASEVLVRCLSQALGRRPVLFRVGEPETSFDEKWLMALARSLKVADAPSLAFLLNSRVPKHARRNLVFLLQNVTDSFSKN